MYNLTKTIVTTGSIAIFTTVLGGCATAEERLDKNLTSPSDNKEVVITTPPPTPAVATTQVEKSSVVAADTAEGLRGQAQKLWDAGDKDKALAVMADAIQRFPDDETN